MTTRPKPSPVSATAAEPAEPACPSRPPPPRHPDRAQFVFILPNDSRSAKRVEEIVLARLTGLGYDEPSLFAVKLALEEAVSNAVRHGNRHHPARFVRVEFSADADAAELAVADEGCGFDPCRVPDPTAAENLELPSGRGIMLMRAFMNEVCYNAAGNCVRMVKLKGAGAPCAAAAPN